MIELTWEDIEEKSLTTLKERKLPEIYEKRLKFEFSEVNNQGTNRYWVEIVEDGKKFDHNKNGLLLPWLLGCLDGDADKDPLEDNPNPTTSTHYKYITKYIKEHGSLPFDISQDDDKPDIDIDCLPDARDPIKDYAARRFGADKVASVGTWTTFLFKQAIQDVSKAIGSTSGRLARGARSIALTVELPDDVNTMGDGGYGKCKTCAHRHKELECPKCQSVDTETPTFARLINDYKEFQQYIDEDPEANLHILETAADMVGKVRTMGKHAGAIIIADRPLLGNIPMAYDEKSGQWSSMWTEGRSTQLSKFGYNKWDILGLKNLQYIFDCCKMVRHNYGVSFGDRMEGWYENIDPEIDQAGLYWTEEDGKTIEHKISMNDPAALKLANEQKTDGVFQFDTSLAKSILKNGVSSFHDLMIFNAMGHPGPMGMIPEYVSRRDGEKVWKNHENEKIAGILKDTEGVIVFQEQLQSLWQNIAGFTAPEAQYARKAVAKKWVEVLKPIRQKWIDGASKIIGEDKAILWWDDIMAPFGRYAFNKSHSVAYCLIAYQCLWLKAYYPEEWWASAMSHCHPKKLPRYMNSARSEGVEFGAIDIGHMTTNFAVSEKKVAVGLSSLKKVGNSICSEYNDDNNESYNEYTCLDDFVEKKGKNKTLLERLIKLGAFKKMHPNVKALWMYYQCKYGSGKPVTAMKAEIKENIKLDQGWDEKAILEERKRQEEEYFNLHPNRKKVPPKIAKWEPKPEITLEWIEKLYPDDYELREILNFELEYLDYYWTSPTDLYDTNPQFTIGKAKYHGKLHGVITGLELAKTKNGDDFYRMNVDDGGEECLIFVWSSELPQPKDLFKQDAGVEVTVNYDERRGTFSLAKSTKLKGLRLKSYGNTNEELFEDEFEYDDE
jgi:DNA polymerase III alpha subunit